MKKGINEPISHQQALDDFGVTELIFHIRNYADEDFNAAFMNLGDQELENLAAILIQRLTHTLNGKLIASYLNAIRHGNSHIIFDPTHWDIPSPSMPLRDSFPDGIKPRYTEGDRVRWRTLTQTTDWGVVIGRFYTYAQHQCQWTVCYLIQLELNSPSAAWIAVDTAWEEDLEPHINCDYQESVFDDGASAFVKQDELTSQPSEETDRANGDGETNSYALPSIPPHLTKTTIPTLTPTRSRHILPKSRHTFPTLHAPSGRYRFEETDPTNPRVLTQRERDLIARYSNCQFGLTPMRFYGKWSVRYQELACICSRSTSTVERWFSRGRNYRRPTFNDLRHLAIMDFLLEHFEEIPSQLLNLLCFPNHSE